MPGRECDDEIAMDDDGAIRRQEQAAIGHAREELDVALDVGGGFDPTGHKLDRERRRRGLEAPARSSQKRRVLGLPQERDTRESGAISLSIASHLPVMPASYMQQSR